MTAASLAKAAQGSKSDPILRSCRRQISAMLAPYACPTPYCQFWQVFPTLCPSPVLYMLEVTETLWSRQAVAVSRQTFGRLCWRHRLIFFLWMACLTSTGCLISSELRRENSLSQLSHREPRVWAETCNGAQLGLGGLGRQRLCPWVKGRIVKWSEH